jgi:hypothetical protein
MIEEGLSDPKYVGDDFLRVSPFFELTEPEF